MKRCLILLLGLVGCGRFQGDVCSLPSAPLVAPRLPAPKTRNLILVTLDGVRWQEIFGGADAMRAPELACGGREALLPNLHALAEWGVSIGDIYSSGPNFVSLPGYREIMTGRASRRCTNNECRHIDEETLLDELSQKFSPDEIAVVASWERIARAAARKPRRITMSAGRHGGSSRDRLRVTPEASRILDEGAASTASPGYLDYRPDRYTAALAREVLVAKQPRFLWVALGDTDEYAHHDDYHGYLDALRAADRFVGELWQLLGEMGAYGAETTLIVTADHGRAADFADHGQAPESAQVWLLAAGGAVTPGEAVSKRTLHLRDIAPTVRVMLGMPEDSSSEAGAPIAALVGRAPLMLSRAAALPRPMDAPDPR